MSNVFDRLAPGVLRLGAIAALAKTGLQLDTAYTYNSAGKAIGVHFVAPVTGNLTDVYFFVSAITGTPGNLSVELRNEGATSPGSTLHVSQTVSPGITANKWIHCTFSSPFSVTQGTLYWVVIGDAAGNGSNNATVVRSSGPGPASSTEQFESVFNVSTTAGGWASGNGDLSACPPIVLKFADGSVLGNPYTTNAAYTSNTRERGLKVVGLTAKLVVSGIIGNLSASTSGFKIYSGNTAPGGTPDLTVTFATGIPTRTAAYFAPFTFSPSTVYRIVFTFSSNATGPGYFQIEDFSGNTDVTNCGFGGGTMYSTSDNGAGGWTDEISKFPRMALVFADQGAGGGGAIIGSNIIVKQVKKPA